jgi:hypothetical protein
MNTTRTAGIVAIAAAALTVTGLGTAYAVTQGSRPPVQAQHILQFQPEIIKYQFTYHRDGTLVFVTTQDVQHHITYYPCSPPAVDTINGNYSISCDK